MVCLKMTRKCSLTQVFSGIVQMVTPAENPIDKYAELTALFRAGLAGDGVAYGQFLQKTTLILRRMLGKKLPPSDVEDVVQDILISLHKARHTHDGQRPLMPWVFAIARFRLNDYLRKAYSRAGHEVYVANIEENAAADVTETYREDESIGELLQDLPERQKRILTLLYLEGHTAKEAGRLLDMGESAIKVAAHRAIKKIRERLGG